MIGKTLSHYRILEKLGVTIHDIDQTGGVDFITMECVAGKLLDELDPRKGLQLKTALKYAVQLALSAAHAATLEISLHLV
jgi:hypothetical protein